MKPATFAEANTNFGPPPDMAESQCRTISAYRGKITGGSLDGETQVVVAWRPDADDLKRLNEGGLIYLGVIGGLPPHFLVTDFKETQRIA